MDGRILRIFYKSLEHSITTERRHAMPKVKSQISFVVLYVKDLDESRTFYEKTLGFPVKQTDEGYVEFDTRGAPLALMSLDAAAALTGATPTASTAVPRFSLSLGEVANVDEVYEELQRAGVMFVKPPQTQPWGQRTTHFSDPDGNLWEVFTWTKKDNGA